MEEVFYLRVRPELWWGTRGFQVFMTSRQNCKFFLLHANSLNSHPWTWNCRWRIHPQTSKRTYAKTEGSMQGETDPGFTEHFSRGKISLEQETEAMINNGNNHCQLFTMRRNKGLKVSSGSPEQFNEKLDFFYFWRWTFVLYAVESVYTLL